MKFGKKRRSLSSIEPSLKNSENMSIRGWFCTKPLFWGYFGCSPSPCNRPTGQGLRSSTYRSLSSTRGAPKVTQISLSEPYRSPMAHLQITVSVFRLNHEFRLIMEGLMVCTVSGGFCMNYCFTVTRPLNHLPYFRNFDDVTNTVVRCFSLFSIKRQYSKASGKRQIWLIWQWTRQLANLVANSDWLSVTVL